MRIGFHVPQWGSSAGREGVLAVARTVEECGLDAVWVADHVVIPTRSAAEYPYAERTPFGPADGFLEALTTLAFAAGATERVTLGTSVLVMPMREPVLTAKVAATIDVLSGGRLALALGAGWWREEFAALGADFSARGKRLDEQIRLMRKLWTEGTASFSGEFYAFDELACEPRPLQPGGPPVLIGGMGERALRRAALQGDGWHAVGVHADTLTAGMETIGRHAEAAGRDLSGFLLSTSTVLASDDEKMLRRLDRLEAAGVAQVVLETNFDRPEAICSAITDFADATLPRLHGGSRGGMMQHESRSDIV